MASDGIDKWRDRQLEVCKRYGAEPVPLGTGEKVGVARNVRTGQVPLNGVRTSPASGTTGWYIWAGDTMSEAEDFFEPLHVEHLGQWADAAMPFLFLPPGWRFLVAGDHVDAWYDPEVGL